jgi:hypothetical protein
MPAEKLKKEEAEKLKKKEAHKEDCEKEKSKIEKHDKQKDKNKIERVGVARETITNVEDLTGTVESLIGWLIEYFTTLHHSLHPPMSLLIVREHRLNLDVLRRFIFVDFEHVLQAALSLEQQENPNLQKKLEGHCS